MLFLSLEIAIADVGEAKRSAPVFAQNFSHGTADIAEAYQRDTTGG